MQKLKYKSMQIIRIKQITKYIYFFTNAGNEFSFQDNKFMLCVLFIMVKQLLTYGEIKYGGHILCGRKITK